MTTATADPQAAQRIWEKLEKLRTAFLVTRGALGLHGRPMSAIVRREEGLIWFLAHAGGGVDDEVAADGEVFLGFSDGGQTYVAITGEAELVRDRARIEALWNFGAEAFWPDGKDDPAMRAIAVRPVTGELWDGPSTPVAVARMALAVITGRSADDEGENVKAAMG
jgi:general stress protein 26